MKIEGRPYYKAEEIDIKAKNLLELFMPGYMQTLRPTPLLSIVDYLRSQYKIVFNFDTTLGFSSDNSRIFGACNPIKRVIFIDPAIRHDEHKFNFTLAHELGHLALHRGVKITYEESDDLVEETAENLFVKNGLRTEKEWLEWQANYYASALMMPDDLLATKLSIIQKLMGIRVGMIYIDEQPSTQKSFSEIVKSLGNYFRVSNMAVEYRLSGLKLINDRRKESIGDHLKNWKA